MEVYEFKTRLCYLPFAIAAFLVAFVVFVIPTPPILQIRLHDWVAFAMFVAIVFSLAYAAYRFIVIGVVIQEGRLVLDYTTRTKTYEIQGLKTVFDFNALFGGLVKIQHAEETVYAVAMIPFWRPGATESFEKMVDSLGYKTPPFVNRDIVTSEDSPQENTSSSAEVVEYPDLFDPIPEERPKEKRAAGESQQPPSSNGDDA